MPTIYLSPSTQEGNFFVSGGTEEEYMNKIADAMTPWLQACGINYVRNSPDMTAATSIRESNAGNYALHLALHSNAAPEGQYGTVQGSEVFYFPSSARGREAAEIIAENLRTIYPGTVTVMPTTAIGEVRLVRAPSVFVEFAYHDNPEDAAWIKNNIDAIAENLVYSLTRFFSLPFLTPRPPQRGRVDVSWGYLNIRGRPSTNGAVLAKAYEGTSLTIWNQWEGWLAVEFDGILGWASASFVTLV